MVVMSVWWNYRDTDFLTVHNTVEKYGANWQGCCVQGEMKCER